MKWCFMKNILNILSKKNFIYTFKFFNDFIFSFLFNGCIKSFLLIQQ